MESSRVDSTKVRIQAPSSVFFRQRRHHPPQHHQPVAAEDAHRLLELRIDAADAGADGDEGDRQEAGDEGDHDDRAGAVEIERRAGIGGVEADRQHDARNDHRAQRQERQHRRQRQQPPLHDVGDAEAEGAAEGRRHRGIGERVPHRLPHGHLLEEDVVEIVEREVVERGAPAPGFCERAVQQHHQRQQHGDQRDQQRIGRQQPLPRAEPDDPAVAALAADRHVAAVRQQQALDPQQQDRHADQRHRERRRDLHPQRMLEERRELGGGDVVARGDRDQRRRAVKRDRSPGTPG